MQCSSISPNCMKFRKKERNPTSLRPSVFSVRFPRSSLSGLRLQRQRPIFCSLMAVLQQPDHSRGYEKAHVIENDNIFDHMHTLNHKP